MEGFPSITYDSNLISFISLAFKTNSQELFNVEMQYDYLNYFAPKSRIIEKSSSDIINEEIDYIVENCGIKSGWDNNKALPLSMRAVSNARKFVKYIEKFELPEINPYPNSDIGFQWNNKKDSINIIFNKDNQILFVISKNYKVTSGFFDTNNIEMAADIVKVFIKDAK